jgi:4-amino-4-deoxy-L-arabinose transferase-like glycosyltransferase
MRGSPHSRAQRATRAPRARMAHALVVLIVLVATVPFLDKAFHIDDDAYLRIARQILKDPLHPYGFSWTVGGESFHVFDHHRSPPLFNYVLAVGLRGFGESELVLHSLSSLFTAALAWSAYALGARFSSHPLRVTVLVVLNPLVLPGQNVMLDVPMLALGMAALAFHVHAIDRASRPLALTGGILAGLAVVTKYPAILVLVVIVIYSAVRRSRLWLPALLAACVPIGAWCVQNLVTEGTLHAVHQLSRPAEFGEGFGVRAMALLAILGSGFVPFLAGVRLGVRAAWHLAALGFSLLAAAAWVVLHQPILSIAWPRALEAGAFLALGELVVLLAIGRVSSRSTPGRVDDAFLLAWLVLGLVAGTAAPFVAVRHVLWAVPPAALVLMRTCPQAGPESAWQGVLVGCVALLGMGVAAADRELANLERDEVNELRLEVAHVTAGVYYSGEHGFAYYCSKLGIRPLLAGADLPARSVLVVSPRTAQTLPRALERRLMLWETIDRSGRIPFSTVSYGVNFYATGVTDLPWHIGQPARPSVSVYVVRPVAAMERSEASGRPGITR